MFCYKCGAENRDDAAFCTNCGTRLSSVASESYNNSENINSVQQNPIQQDLIQQTPIHQKKSLRERHGLLISFAVLLCLFLAFIIIPRMLNAKYVDLVKNSYLPNYPYTTYGKAFDMYFDKPSWEYGKTTSNKDIVEFNGVGKVDYVGSAFKMQFEVSYDAKTYELRYFSIDDEPQTIDKALTIILKAFLYHATDGKIDAANSAGDIASNVGDAGALGIHDNQQGQLNKVNNSIPIDSQANQNQLQSSNRNVNSRSYDFSSVTVGSAITFGQYEQDNNPNNGLEDIEWIVLSKTDGEMLVISKNGLDCQPFNNGGKGATWDTCSLRLWLNDTFINGAFSSDEQARIRISDVSADKNPAGHISTNPGSDTQDKIFLLSNTEVERFGVTLASNQCRVTDYAISRGAFSSDNKMGMWWLRTPGSNSRNAVLVDNTGTINYNGGSVDYDKVAVRPVMRIQIK